MRIHQIVPSSSFASTSSASPSPSQTQTQQVAIARMLLPLLRSVDPESSIYADVSTSESFAESLVILHVGALSNQIVEALIPHAERLVVVASDGFDSSDGGMQTLPFDPEEGGRRLAMATQLERLATRAARAVAFSAQSAGLLRERGFFDVVVCPPLVDVTALTTTQPHAPTANHFEKMVTGKLFVVLNDISPVSRSALIVQAYHILATYFDPTAHLALAGQQHSRYGECIEHEINELNLNRAWIAEGIGASERRVYLDNASVVVTTRLGEADHTSLLQAMHAGVPIVATESRGLEELCSGAALVLPESASATLLAEAMIAVATDAHLRDQMAAAGKARSATHDLDVALARLVDAIFGVVP